jgi:hypothetical protein
MGKVDASQHGNIGFSFFPQQFGQFKTIGTTVAGHVNDGYIGRTKISSPIMKKGMLAPPSMSVLKQGFGNGPKAFGNAIGIF